MDGINQPRTRRGQLTFNKIKATAERLFHEKGYHLTTIGDITDQAGLAAGTFYLYFDDKYSLYRSLLLEYSHQIRSAIAQATEGIMDRYELEKVGLRTFIRFARDNPSAYTLIWQSLQVDKQLFVEYYQSFARRYFKGLEYAQKRQDIKVPATLTAAYLLMGIANFVGLQVLMLEDQLDSDESIDQIVHEVMDILEKGLLINKKVSI